MKSVWGKTCLVDGACAKSISYCDRSQGEASKLSRALSNELYSIGKFARDRRSITAIQTGFIAELDGRCRPMLWVWVVLVGLVIGLICSCVCCACNRRPY